MPASFNPRALGAHVAVLLGTLMGWLAAGSTGSESLVLTVLAVGWLLLAARVVASTFVGNIRTGLLRLGIRPSPQMRPSLRLPAHAGGAIVVAMVATAVLTWAIKAAQAHVLGNVATGTSPVVVGAANGVVFAGLLLLTLLTVSSLFKVGGGVLRKSLTVLRQLALAYGESVAGIVFR